MVHGSHVLLPGFVLVVQDGGAQAPRRVDACAGDRDGRQVHHEHRQTDRERRHQLKLMTNHIQARQMPPAVITAS